MAVILLIPKYYRLSFCNGLFQALGRRPEAFSCFYFPSDKLQSSLSFGRIADLLNYLIRASWLFSCLRPSNGLRFAIFAFPSTFSCFYLLGASHKSTGICNFCVFQYFSALYLPACFPQKYWDLQFLRFPVLFCASPSCLGPAKVLGFAIFPFPSTFSYFCLPSDKLQSSLSFGRIANLHAYLIQASWLFSCLHSAKVLEFGIFPLSSTFSNPSFHRINCKAVYPLGE